MRLRLTQFCSKFRPVKALLLTAGFLTVYTFTNKRLRGLQRQTISFFCSPSYLLRKISRDQILEISQSKPEWVSTFSGKQWPSLIISQHFPTLLRIKRQEQVLVLCRQVSTTYLIYKGLNK